MSQISEEESYCLRFWYLNYKVAPKAVRIYFDSVHPPGRLCQELSSQKLQLVSNRFINSNQRLTLYPPTGIQVKSDSFDLTLLICLLRNMQPPVTSPVTGFDQLPLPGDISIGADLARAKYYRNMIAHTSDPKLSIAEFNNYWSDLEAAIGRLGGQLLLTEAQSSRHVVIDESFKDMLLKLQYHALEKIKEDIDDINTEINVHNIEIGNHEVKIKELTDLLMQGQQNIEEIKNEISRHEHLIDEHKQIIDSCRQEIGKNEQKLKCLEEHIETILKQNEYIMQTVNIHTEIIASHDIKINQLDQRKDNQGTCINKLKITEWEKQDAKFVATDAVTFILQELETCHTMNVTGVPGVGKSATVRHVALLLGKKGYTVLPCSKPSDILKQYKEGTYQVFVVEDVCGRFTLIPYEVNKWVKEEEEIEIILKQSKSKILLTTRLQVFLENDFKNVKVFNKCVCNLSSETFALSLEKKQQIAQKYCNNPLIVKEILEWIETSTFLPLTCLFCSMYEEDSTFDVQKLLRNPFMFFKNEWDKLWKQNDKTKFCALLFLVIFNGSVTEQSMSDTKKNKLIFEVCNLDRGTSRYKIMDQLDSLSRTYVKKQGDQFTVIHSTIMDYLCGYFGDACNQRFQKALLLCADDKVISERTQLESLKVAFENFTIVITEQNEALYFDRIYEEIEKCNVIGVICNRQIHLELYRNKLITAMRTLDKKVISKFFNTKDSISGLTALWMACHLGYLKLIFFILKFVKDISEYENDWLPLHASIKCDNNKLLKSLLAKGAGINQKNEYGLCPLMVACDLRKPEMVKSLIARGADVNAVCSKGNSVLRWMCEYAPDQNILKILLENKEVDINKTGERGWTPLIFCSTYLYKDFVSLLIEYGANINQTSTDGWTPLYCACSQPSDDPGNLVTYIVVPKYSDYGLKGFDQLKKEGKMPHALPFRTEKVRRNSVLTKGHEVVAKFLIDNKADVNICSNEGKSPLMLECEHNEKGMIKLLLEKGADIHRADRNGFTAFTWAVCSQGSIDTLNILIDKGADLHKADNKGVTPLMYGCLYRGYEISHWLINRGAKVTDTDKNGRTPLMWACMYGDYDLIGFLLERCNNVNDTCHDGRTAAMYACLHGNRDILEFLIQKGADVSKMDKDGNDVMIMTCRGELKGYVQLFFINTFRNGKSLLSVNSFVLACMHGCYRTVKRLIQSGVSVNSCNNEGQTPIMFVCRHRQIQSRLLNGIIIPFDYIQILNLLIKQGADIHKGDNNGRTPLMYAASDGHFRIIKFLVKKGADINKGDEVGRTPLMFACMRGRSQVINLFKESGATLDQCDKDGRTAFMWAAVSGRYTILDQLIVNGVDINKTDNVGKTALMYACEKGFKRIVCTLLKNGAIFDNVDKSGMGPIQLARSQGHLKIAKMLKRKMSKNS